MEQGNAALQSMYPPEWWWSELRESIEKIKSGLRTKRVEADLAKLLVERPEDYRRIASIMEHEVEKMPAESARR